MRQWIPSDTQGGEWVARMWCRGYRPSRVHRRGGQAFRAIVRAVLGAYAAFNATRWFAANSGTARSAASRIRSSSAGLCTVWPAKSEGLA